MHFVYSLWNGYNKTAVLEYQHHYPHHSIPHRRTFDTMHRILKQIGLFPRAIAEREQWHGEGNILDAVQRSPGTRIHRISRITGTAQKQVCRIFHHGGSNPYQLQKVQHLLLGVIKTVYDYVHSYNHSYKFCLTFSSQEAQFTRDCIENTKSSPLRICLGCSVPETYQSPDWALVSAQTGPRAEYL